MSQFRASRISEPPGRAVPKVGAEFFIPATEFRAVLGSPTLGNVGGSHRYNAWVMNHTTDSWITANVLLPDWWLTFEVDVVWANDGEGSGDVVMRSWVRERALDGESLPDDGQTDSSSGKLVLTTGAFRVSRTTPFLAPRANTGKLWAFTVVRYGTDADDTLNNSIGVLGIRIRLTTPLLDSVPADHAGSQVVLASTTETTVVAVSDVPSATNLREQDSIVRDPDDPNLGANPERLHKFYFTAVIGGASRVWVTFSEDGRTGWTTPVACVMGGSDRNSEDPSVVTLLDRQSQEQVHRDGDGKMHVYVEDKATDTIYAYESTDGITWTELASNPAIAKGGAGTWDVSLVGSPIARHDGTRYLVGYEGISTPNEMFGIAYGADPAALTKSPNNPVWDPREDPGIVGTKLIPDAFFLSRSGSAIYFLAHGVSTGSTTDLMYRGRTGNLDPTTWVEGDIRAIGGNVHPSVFTDFTLDGSSGGLRRAVTHIDQKRMVTMEFSSGA